MNEKAAAGLSSEDFMKLVVRKVPVLVDFYADWCEPCKFLDEILQELEIKFGDGLLILKADLDEQPELMQHFGMRSVPWLMLYVDGSLKWKMPGFMTTRELEEIIRSKNISSPEISE